MYIHIYANVGLHVTGEIIGFSINGVGQMSRHLEENEDGSIAKALQQPKIQIVTKVTKNWKYHIYIYVIYS